MLVRRPLKTEGRRIFKRGASEIAEAMLSGALPTGQTAGVGTTFDEGIAEIPGEGATP
jgi:hypothetical protein